MEKNLIDKCPSIRLIGRGGVGMDNIDVEYAVNKGKMAIAIAKAGGIGVIHRNLDIKKQISEIKKVKKHKL